MPLLLTIIATVAFLLLVGGRWAGIQTGVRVTLVAGLIAWAMP